MRLLLALILFGGSLLSLVGWPGEPIGPPVSPYPGPTAPKADTLRTPPECIFGVCK